MGTWVNKGMYHVSNLFEYWEFGNLLMKNQNRKIMENSCALMSYVYFSTKKRAIKQKGDKMPQSKWWKQCICTVLEIRMHEYVENMVNG